MIIKEIKDRIKYKQNYYDSKNYIYYDSKNYIYYDLNVDWKNRFHFFLYVNHKSFFLYSSRITYEYWFVDIINPRDKVMLEYLGFWLKDLKDYNNIEFYIRVKAAGNEEFLKWWHDYDFTISKEPLL